MGMTQTSTVIAGLKPDLSLLFYAGPPILFGWVGTGVFVVFLWWTYLAIGAFLQECRPHPHYDEGKRVPIAFGIALVAFIAFYYAARWLAPV